MREFIGYWTWNGIEEMETPPLAFSCWYTTDGLLLMSDDNAQDAL
jgi:hypothetical protein